MVIDGALSASIGHLGLQLRRSSTTSFGIEPAFDYFSSRNFSQGVSALLPLQRQHLRHQLSRTRALTFGMTGHAVPSTCGSADRVSLWPRLALGVWQSQTTLLRPSGTFSVSVDGTAVPPSRTAPRSPRTPSSSSSTPPSSFTWPSTSSSASVPRPMPTCFTPPTASYKPNECSSARRARSGAGSRRSAAAARSRSRSSAPPR